MAEPTNMGRRPVVRNLQYSPFKEGEQQYVVLWDPSGLSAERLIVPLNYFYLFQFFDGEHALDQIAGLYLKKFGEFLLPDRLEKLVAELDEKLFLEGDRLEAAKQAADAAYRAQPLRKAAYAGRSYEADAEKLTAQIEACYASKEGPEVKTSLNKGKRIKGLVAPHHEIRKAGAIYAWAYKEVQEAALPDLFVILGTCQGGLRDGFAVTDKDFETPLGVLPADREVASLIRLRAGAPTCAAGRLQRRGQSSESEDAFSHADVEAW